jgi:hypothetical protein
MNHKNDHSIDVLIDLGSIVEETKGAAGSGSDTFNQRQLSLFGLHDD